MIACVDTHYWPQGSRTALVIIEHWVDGIAVHQSCQEDLKPSAEYVPGEFFRRELPCILSLVPSFPEGVETVVIDGYVWLDEYGRKGLGALLYEALDETLPIIGVAKNRFQGSSGIEVFRGDSRRPLIVTAAGMEVGQAAEHIQSMHGPHRIPTMLKKLDSITRQGIDREH